MAVVSKKSVLVSEVFYSTHNFVESLKMRDVYLKLTL